MFTFTAEAHARWLVGTASRGRPLGAPATISALGHAAAAAPDLCRVHAVCRHVTLLPRVHVRGG
eukprot:3670241-Rhodomonas_salina.1